MSYFHPRAREEHGDDTPALAMGDFNDEPFDTSLVIHALSSAWLPRSTTRPAAGPAPPGALDL